MSPALISETATRPRQAAFWSDAFDPYAVADEERSDRSDTLFFAVKPPPHLAEHIYRFGGRARATRGLSCSLILARCLHLTLLGVGIYQATSAATIEALRDAAAMVAIQPFRLTLNRTMSFGDERKSDNRPFVLIGDDSITIGLHQLRHELASALRQVGFRPRLKAFTPHMTLFYSGHDLGEDSVAEIGWTVCHFALVHSVHGQRRHELLGVWRLGSTG